MRSEKARINNSEFVEEIEREQNSINAQIDFIEDAGNVFFKIIRDKNKIKNK